MSKNLDRYLEVRKERKTLRLMETITEAEEDRFADTLDNLWWQLTDKEQAAADSGYWDLPITEEPSPETRKSIERGLADSAAGRTKPLDMSTLASLRADLNKSKDEIIFEISDLLFKDLGCVPFPDTKIPLQTFLRVLNKYRSK